MTVPVQRTALLMPSSEALHLGDGGGGGVLGPSGNLPTNPTMSNILPGYSDTFGPPSWVSPPTISAITAAERDADHIDDFLLGVVLANITAINHSSLLS